MEVKIGKNNKIKNSIIIGGSQNYISNSSCNAEKETLIKTILKKIIPWIMGTVVVIVLGRIFGFEWDKIMELILGR